MADVDEPLLSLSELVQQTGVPASTVHHYLRLGLIPPARRLASNRFAYETRHVTTLALVRVLRERGLGLDEIAASLPSLLDSPDQLAAVTAEDPGPETDVANRLVEAAIAAFQTHSYADVAVSDVAEAAGVAKGSVYRHFSSKEELFTAAIERLLSRATADFADAVERLGGAAGVARVPEKTAEVFAGLVAGAMPMLLELGTRAAKGHVPSERLARRVLRTLAEAAGGPIVGDSGDDPVQAGLAVIQTAFSLVLQWAVGPGWPPDLNAGS